jgi:hypothetical protein
MRKLSKTQTPEDSYMPSTIFLSIEFGDFADNESALAILLTLAADDAAISLDHFANSVATFFALPSRRVSNFCCRVLMH